MSAAGAVDGARELLAIERACGAIDVRAVAGDGGERDGWRGLSRRDRRRIVGANVDGVRVVRSGGESFDTACERWNDAHGSDLSVDEFVGEWARRVLVALDARADVRVGTVRDDLSGRPDPELPGWVAEWVGSLLIPEKRDYAVAVAAALYAGEQEPERPSASWAERVERKVINRYNAAVARGEVA